MSAQRKPSPVILGWSPPGEVWPWTSAEYAVWRQPERTSQMLGRKAGEALRRLANSGLGKAAIWAYNYLKPTNAPRNVASEPANHNPRGVEPAWADLTQPRKLRLTTVDLDWLATHTSQPGAGMTERHDPTIGIYTEPQLLKIELAVAAVHASSFPMFANATRAE